jgi:hypothetical protein
MMMEFIVIWLAMGIITAVAANARGRSGLAWFFLGCLFSFFALLAVLVMPRVERQQQGGGTAPAAPTPLPSVLSTIPATSAAEEIEKLAQLRDRGILTDAEFQSRKERVLNA